MPATGSRPHGRLSGVTSRPLLAVAAAVLTLSACGSISDNDVVASVDDAELTNDDLRDLAGDLDELPAQDARGAISAFLVTELLTADLETLGVDVDVPDTSELPSAQALQTRQDVVIASWTTLDPTVLVDDTMLATYSQGADSSGIVCAAHILVSTSEEAEAILDALDAGSDWNEIAPLTSIDPSGSDGGFLACLPPDEIRATFVPEFAEAALQAEVGVPTGPVETEFGFHVIRLVPPDELNLGAAVTLRLQTFDDRFDIYIDPRFGEWDPNGIVVPTR